jgi:hypothetical protein
MVNTSLEMPLPVTSFTRVNHAQADTTLFELGEHGERIEGTAEHTVEFGRDDDIVRLHAGSVLAYSRSANGLGA